MVLSRSHQLNPALLPKVCINNVCMYQYSFSMQILRKVVGRKSEIQRTSALCYKKYIIFYPPHLPYKKVPKQSAGVKKNWPYLPHLDLLYQCLGPCK